MRDFHLDIGYTTVKPDLRREMRQPDAVICVTSGGMAGLGRRGVYRISRSAAGKVSLIVVFCLCVRVASFTVYRIACAEG